MSDASMTETGRILLDNLNLNEKGLRKRQMSNGTYEANTPSAYDAKVQRVSFLGARKPGVVPQMWSTEEDDALQRAVEKHGEKNWRVIAEEIPGRNHLQCLQRWKKALRPGLKKGHWSKEEDDKLLGFIKSYTEKGSINNINWGAIAQQIDGRNAKQCRERWFLNLDPSINRGPWTADEDRRLLELAAQCGGRWSLIAKNMEGRTENSVKTRYHSLQRQEARNRGWTAEEDQTLLDAALVFGRKWKKIVKQLPGRSSGQLKKRFAMLTQHRPDLVRQVQAVEDQIEKGLVKEPNPPPPPIQPIGAQYLQSNLQLQQQGQTPMRAPVVSPFVGPNAVSAPPPPMRQDDWGTSPTGYFTSPPPPSSSGAPPPKKGLSKYGSSWMAGFVDNQMDAPQLNLYGSEMAGPGSRGPGPSLMRTNSQKVLNDFFRGDELAPGPPAPRRAPPQRQDTANLALLDKLLQENTSSSSATASDVSPDPFAVPPALSGDASGQPTKGLKQYNSWGSLGGGDYGLFGSGPSSLNTDTTNGTGAPPIMRTGSSKKLNTMPSSNWGVAPGASPALNSYETGDIKSFLNML